MTRPGTSVVTVDRGPAGPGPERASDGRPSGVTSPLPDAWRGELSGAIRDPAEVCRLLGLDEATVEEARRAAGGFPCLVPRPFLARMRHGDPRDPLLLQVLPRAAETTSVPGWIADPLEEAAAMAGPALVKKYRGRALLMATGACAVHCRYCFRRDFPYAEQGVGSAGLDAALETIAADPTIEEVILSGGDPLVLDDDRLERLFARLAAIVTVRRLRIHTRLPVVIPARVTPRLVRLLAGTAAPAVCVIHANHAAEIGADVVAALRDLRSAGVMLLNQSVLLAGVNDSLDALVALSEGLLGAGVLPYYLHLPDRVAGTSHFDVAEDVARGLHEAMRGLLPGYAVPRLVREVPGEPAKVSLG